MGRRNNGTKTETPTPWCWINGTGQMVLCSEAVIESMYT